MSYALTVSFIGTGTGSITASPGTLSCTGNPCGASYSSGTIVTLTPSASANSSFVGWSGACIGQTTCTVTMSAARTVTANFALVTHSITVAKPGQGSGTITSSPAGISCGVGCFNVSAPFTQGQQLTLTAAPSTNSVFGGWNAGPCAGSTNLVCSFTVTAPVTVQGTFDLAQRTLTAALTGRGTGTILSAQAGIQCNPDCSEPYAHGSVILLSAIAAPGSRFVQWTGACTGTQTSCSVTMNADVTATAEFALEQYALSVSKLGSGSGTVTSSPAGLSCGASCSANFDYLSMVTLTASAATGSTFAGWGGYCISQQPTCLVTVDQARSVTATFDVSEYTLQLATVGNGTLAPSPVGTSCGSNCYRYPHGTVVTVTPTGGTGSSLASWSGDCTGSGTCAVTMTGPRSVTGTFAINRYTVTVVRTGTGSGLIASTPTGIDCGTACTFQFLHGTFLTLGAAPDDQGIDFDGWSGPCTGTGACNVTITGPVTITGSFTRNRQRLTITKPADGYGIVSSVPAGVFCGGNCTGFFATGTVVTLTALAANTPEAQNSTFIGWGGACTGTGTCTVTMSAAQSVSANFKLKPNFAFVTSTKHDANFGGLAGADTYCQQAANAAALPGTFKALLGTATVFGPSRLAPASGWVLPNGRPIANLRDDLGFRMFYPVRMTETGVDLVAPVDEYAFAASIGTECGEFTNTTGSAFVGFPQGIGLALLPSGPMPCATAQRLFCFGVDRPATVTAPTPPPSVRYAFVTSNQWLPGGGLTDADARCQADATAANLPGTYKALLATNTASAGSRFSIVGAPWVRVDGVPLTSSASAFFTTSFLDTTPLLEANGTVRSAGIWTGVPGGGTLMSTVGNASTTCDDWTNAAGTAASGANMYTRASYFVNLGSAQACTQMGIRLVCLQE